MMFSALATMLLAAAPNVTAQAREGYARCIKQVVAEAVEKKMDVAAFDAAVASTCKDKEAAFRNAMVASEVAMGIKRAVSEKGVSEEIADYRSMAKEDLGEALKASAPK